MARRVQGKSSPYKNRTGNLFHLVMADLRIRPGIGAQDNWFPTVIRQIAREFEGSMYSAAARVGRIVKGNHQDLFHALNVPREFDEKQRMTNQQCRFQSR